MSTFSRFPLWLRLSGLLFASHLLAALTAMWLAERAAGWPLPALAAAGLGVLVTLPLGLVLERLFAVVRRLEQQQPVSPLAWRRFGPLAAEAARLDALAQRLAEVTALRSGWLAQAQQAAAQQERNRLARELHDSIKQQLFSLQMSLAAAQAHLPAEAERAQAALQNARLGAQEALAEMNALLQQLSPAPLEKVGLVQALRDQCEALGYRSGAAVEAAFGELPGEAQLPPGAQEGLFRIAQEALSNIARHARARQVRLVLGLATDRPALELRIDDDGQGFDPQAQAAGMGLANMRQRAQALGGELAVTSAAGKGAAIHLTIPLLSPFDIPEESMSPTDHTLNKAFAAGLLGGLALIALLYYPLAVLLPAHYVAGWPAGEPLLGPALQGAAALAAIATGYLGARWAKAGALTANLLVGALAGGVAGVILFFGLGGAAAGLAGNALILRNGPVATPEAQGIALLVESLRRTVQLCYGFFWLSFAAGAGLGALGGLFVPPAAPRPRPGLLHGGRGVLTAASLGGALALALNTTIYGVLEPTIWRSIAENNLQLPAGPAVGGVTVWPFISAALLYLAALAGLYLLLRRELRQADPLRLVGIPGLAYFYASVALASSLQALQFLVSSEPGISGMPVIAVSGLACLALGGLFAAAGRQAEQQARQAGLALSPGRFGGAVLVLGSVLILMAVAWAMSSSTPAIYLFPLVLAALGLVLAVRQWRTWKQQDALLQARQWALVMQDYGSASVGAVALLLVTLYASVTHSLGLVLIPISFIAPMFATPEQPFKGTVSALQQVQQLYLYNANLLLVALALCAAAVGVIGVVGILVRRRLPAA